MALPHVFQLGIPRKWVECHPPLGSHPRLEVVPHEILLTAETVATTDEEKALPDDHASLPTNCLAPSEALKHGT